eukprot:m.764562 g.764562  ORF g.764562 m.764562 type:complete len:60 (-) comp23217_c0_seq18:897-1076(-)
MAEQLSLRRPYVDGLALRNIEHTHAPPGLIPLAFAYGTTGSAVPWKSTKGGLLLFPPYR